MRKSEKERENEKERDTEKEKKAPRERHGEGREKNVKDIDKRETETTKHSDT